MWDNGVIWNTHPDKWSVQRSLFQKGNGDANYGGRVKLIRWTAVDNAKKETPSIAAAAVAAVLEDMYTREPLDVLSILRCVTLDITLQLMLGISIPKQQRMLVMCR